MEKIFPPPFFDVMQHLPIHLPYEAELGGPVQYRWMYLFERNFKKLKANAKNKRYAVGSIVEAYMGEKYPDISEEELSTKRADEYHIWVKDYVCLSNYTCIKCFFFFILIYIYIYIYIYI